MTDDEDHFYVFTLRGGSFGMIPVYERTCGHEPSAQWWVDEYERQGLRSFYTSEISWPKLVEGPPPNRFWY